MQSVSEEWTELPWLTTSYSSQWTNVVVFLFTFLNFIFLFAFLYLVVSNQSCMIAVVQMQFKLFVICSLKHKCFGVLFSSIISENVNLSKFTAAHSPKRG